MSRRRLGVAVGALVLLLAGCSSEPGEQAQVVSVTPTSVPTTAPVSLPTPTSTPEPAPTPSPAPQVTSTPIPVATAAPTADPTAAPDPEPSPTVGDVSPAPTVAPTATVVVEVVETPTPVPTATVEEDTSGSDPDPTPTEVAATPTVVAVASGEPPLECYDAQVRVYRAFVEGVDDLSFENGRVFCSGAGTNAVSAAGSYRHSTGLVITRNADYIFNSAGTAYIPYSGFVHFCVSGQPASAPVRADTVPALLVVIDAEAQRQVAQGAAGPTTFNGSGSQC